MSNYLQGALVVLLAYPAYTVGSINVGCSLDIEYTIQFKDFYDGLAIGQNLSFTNEILAQLQHRLALRRPQIEDSALPARECDEKDDASSEFTDVELHQFANTTCGFGCSVRRIPCVHGAQQVVRRPNDSTLPHFSVSGDEPDAQFWAWVKQKEADYDQWVRSRTVKPVKPKGGDDEKKVA